MADVTVKATRNGPYEVSGNFQILDAAGQPFDASKQTFKGKVYLCRCGQSNTKPFCDGTHNKVGFKHELKA
ncbi:MAG: CDGSH iron-sulfur domain-containing protein [Chloroflexi bacterium]|nr:CDGSH iron-sulfur domain-containing protein [Chloroflexota bacterium]